MFYGMEKNEIIKNMSYQRKNLQSDDEEKDETTKTDFLYPLLKMHGKKITKNRRF